MCISKIKPIRHKTGFGYAIKGRYSSTSKKTFRSILKDSRQFMNRWSKAKSCSYSPDPDQIGFHFFKNKKNAILLLKNSVCLEDLILVKLQYKEGKFDGVVSEYNSRINPLKLPCSTAMRIKILEVISYE